MLNQVSTAFDIRLSFPDRVAFLLFSVVIWTTQLLLKPFWFVFKSLVFTVSILSVYYCFLSFDNHSPQDAEFITTGIKTLFDQVIN